MAKVAKILLIDSNSKYLLLHRGNHPTFGVDPDLPGGTVEDGEALLEAAVREVFEETGITVDPVDVRYVYDGTEYSKHGTHYALYAVKLDNRPEVQLSWEHSTYAWLDRNDFLKKAQSANDTYMHMVYDQLRNEVTRKHSAGGVVLHEGKVLTISWTDQDYVCFPKGGIDSGETSEQAAVREVWEETGYRVQIVAPIRSWSYDYEDAGLRYQKKVDYYTMHLINDAPPTPHREPGENFENLWLSVEEAMRRLTFNDAKEALQIAIDA